MQEQGRYIATVLLWPSRHKDQITDAAEQRRLHAYHSPLTAEVRRFHYFPRAHHWCKVMVAKKHRATRWYWIDEETPSGRVEVENHAFDWMHFTEEEYRRIEADAKANETVVRSVHMKPGLLAQVDALAAFRQITFSELMAIAAAELVKRAVDELSEQT